MRAGRPSSQMENFIAIEDAIITALADAIPWAKVAALDDAPKSGDLLKKQSIFVVRAGMTADDDAGPSCSDCAQFWKVYLCSSSASVGKARRGDQGIYAMELAAIAALQDKTLGFGGINGFKLAGSENFLDEDNPEYAGQMLTFVFREMVGE